MRTNKLIALTLAATLTIAVAACGSSDSAKALTKAGFIKEADAKQLVKWILSLDASKKS